MFRVGVRGVAAIATFAGKTCYADSDPISKPKAVLLKTPTFTPPPYQRELNSSPQPLKGRVENKKLSSYEILKISGQDSGAKVVLGTTVALAVGSCLSKDVGLGAFKGSSMSLGVLMGLVIDSLRENKLYKSTITANEISNLETQKNIKELYLNAKLGTEKEYMLRPAKSTLLAPVLEEIFFRRFLQGELLPGIISALALTPPNYTAAISLVIVAVIFGAGHLLNGKGSEGQAAFATIGGIVNGMIYNEHGLWAAIAGHSANNTIAEVIGILAHSNRAYLLDSGVNALIDSSHMDKISMEVVEQNIIKLGYDILKDPECFILLLMLITCNKDLSKEEKQKLRSKLIDLLPKDLELRSVVKNMLNDKIYEFIKDGINVTAISRSGSGGLVDDLIKHIGNQLLTDCGFEKKEIEEIAFIALKKQWHLSQETIDSIRKSRF